ncbi:MAG: GNAT family N-acetyltransferase [Dysgonamonadaceae bacterium]|jgi:predicted acetyltransferase|nr:GNAT family N-acetyltransferase [Dysgonamonadaceae bacterium]
MITFSEDGYKPALKIMWKCSFPTDTDSFIDFYFREVYKNDETLVYLEDREVVAALQMIPYTLKNHSETLQAGYISGAMTHPDFRRRGFMKALMYASFETMRAKHYDYTFLIPQETWLFRFYEKFGYNVCVSSPFLPESKTFHNSQHPEIPFRVYIYGNAREIADVQSVYSTYSRLLSAIPQVILKTETQFRHILHDLFNENGVLFIGKQGVAFTSRRANSVVIKEFLYQNQQAKDLLLKTISGYYAPQNLVIDSDPNLYRGLRGMIMGLNADTAKISDLYINMMLEGDIEQKY